MAEKRVKQQRRYLSYLLRLWRENNGEPPLWRASLETPQSHMRQGFASLAELVAFLENETGASSPRLERRDKDGRQPPAMPE